MLDRILARQMPDAEKRARADFVIATDKGLDAARADVLIVAGAGSGSGAMREIVLDTETTGLDPDTGDRIVEIGAVELVNHMPTGRIFHAYINPQRDVPAEAVEVHGLTAAFLSDKPVFAAVAAEFAAFIGDARLVIHNAAFDMRFLNAELGWAGQPGIAWARAVDTLELARRRFPGAQNTLDALCRRFGVDNCGREKHGALLDSELLAEVYLELMGGRQPDLVLSRRGVRKPGRHHWTPPPRPRPLAGPPHRRRSRRPRRLRRRPRRRGALALRPPVILRDVYLLCLQPEVPSGARSLPPFPPGSGMVVYQSRHQAAVLHRLDKIVMVLALQRNEIDISTGQPDCFIGDFAHRVEDLLVAVREGRRSFTPATVEAVFASADAVRLMLAAATERPDGLESAVSRASALVEAALGNLAEVAAAVPPSQRWPTGISPSCRPAEAMEPAAAAWSAAPAAARQHPRERGAARLADEPGGRAGHRALAPRRAPRPARPGGRASPLEPLADGAGRSDLRGQARVHPAGHGSGRPRVGGGTGARPRRRVPGLSSTTSRSWSSTATTISTFSPGEWRRSPPTWPRCRPSSRAWFA